MEACDLAATEARRQIGIRALSPVELLDSCLGRIEQVNKQLNAIVAIDRERAIEEALEAERAVTRGDVLGVLHGIPVAIKDLTDTAGLRTTYGSRLFAEHIPQQDEGVVADLRRAGAVVQMKTNTPEWGAGANTFNPVYGVSGNPFDLALTCGGSSGGSGIAVATGMSMLAQGSDNAGSLRVPAAYCGVVGMRPTAGLVASEKRAPGLNPFPVLGPMARNVRDTLLLLSAMLSDDRRDPLAGKPEVPIRPDLPPIDTTPLRIAISADLGGFASVSHEVRELFHERFRIIEDAFASVDEAAPDFAGADRVHDVLRGVAFVGMYSTRAKEHPGELGPLVSENLARASAFTIDDVGAAQMRLTQIYWGAQQFFEQYDLLVIPTVSVPPWPKEQMYPGNIDDYETQSYIDWLRFTYAITLLNHPAISIPCGVDRNGLPVAVQLVSGRRTDAWLMQAALAVESLFESEARTKRPIPNIEELAGQDAEDPRTIRVQ